MRNTRVLMVTTQAIFEPPIEGISFKFCRQTSQAISCDIWLPFRANRVILAAAVFPQYTPVKDDRRRQQTTSYDKQRSAKIITREL